MTDSKALWTRHHQNGMRIIVREVEPGQYSIEVFSGRTVTFNDTVHGSLQNAQQTADAASNCSQPCRCEAWR